METNEIRTIDVHAKEWHDKVNGNSYFSVEIVLNYGLANQEVTNLPIQYGYGLQYVDAVAEKFEAGNNLFRWCRERGIILRTHKCRRCLKREVVAWGQTRIRG